MAQCISVVIPVYKAEGSIEELYRRLKQTLEGICGEFEIIMVEDCGGDRSWEIISKLEKMDARVTAIQLSRNFGQHSALLCGIREARYDIIVTIDDDLQHPPEEISKLLDKLAEGYDVVYGAPRDERHGVWRNMASQLTKMVLKNAMGAETARNISAFRAFRSYVRDAFENYQGSFVSIDVLLTWATNRFTAIRVRHDPRPVGQSNYTVRMLITHSLNMMTGFSTLPLQLASITGFAFAFFGLAMLSYVLGTYFIQGSSVPGFPFLASIISIFSGTQLFALGIIGEYLARIHFRTMERMPYVIRYRSRTDPASPAFKGLVNNRNDQG